MQTVINSGKSKHISCQHEDSETEPNSGAGADVDALITQKISSGVHSVCKRKRENKKTALKAVEEKKRRLNTVRSNQSTYNMNQPSH